jgi:hypothetical protein
MMTGRGSLCKKRGVVFIKVLCLVVCCASACSISVAKCFEVLPEKREKSEKRMRRGERERDSELGVQCRYRRYTSPQTQHPLFSTLLDNAARPNPFDVRIPY